MTRTYPGLDRPAAAPIRRGTRFGASLAVKDRRLAEAAVTLTGDQAPPIGFLALPTFGLVGSASLIGSAGAGSQTLVRATVPDRLQGPSYAADPITLAFFASPPRRTQSARAQGTARGKPLHLRADGRGRNVVRVILDRRKRPKQA